MKNSKMRSGIRCALSFLCLAGTGFFAPTMAGSMPTAEPAPAIKASPPRLILQITVDALRADLPERYGHLLGEGGFRYLLDSGVNFIDANYQHANTETIVGHASLATGTVPAVHGMVGNVWFDQQLGRLVYNIEDPDYRLLSADADVDKANEIDPTQKAAKVDGRSPANIRTSTFSDELAVHHAGRSKIFGVSVKDRGAVSMAGRAGKAFWFSKKTGEFVTSTYYYDAYPEWVRAWNARQPTAAYSGKAWTLSAAPETYLFGDADDRAYETDLAGFGRTFPHAYGAVGDKYFTTKLTLSPAGDELTLDFAKALVVAEALGADEVPDYLSISFSSTDYVGHMFGASSLESEDNLRRLDRVLADLFAFIDERVGLAQTLIVLSADHGQPEVPGHLHERGIRDARYFDPESIDRTPMVEAMRERFGLAEELFEDYFAPYVYLDQDAVAEHNLDPDEVARAMAAELRKFDGVADAVATCDIAQNRLPATEMTQAVGNNFFPGRSGDIHVVLEPNVYINDFDGLRVASSHGSPWRYDTFVPVIFAGHGLAPATVARTITPYDIAPTLSAYLGVKPPSGAVGAVLPEIRLP